MNGERFLDTNVLIYVFDATDGQKHETAKQIVRDVTNGRVHGVVSNQVLAELFHVLTTKHRFKMDKTEVRDIVNGFIDSPHWRKINYTASTVSKAMKRAEENGTPLWDALIAETMAENGVYTLLTENAKDFEGGPVKAVNPFV